MQSLNIQVLQIGFHKLYLVGENLGVCESQIYPDYTKRSNNQK